MKELEKRHISVLLEPVLEALDPKPGQVVVDCTLGLGGHSAAILARICPGGGEEEEGNKGLKGKKVVKGKKSAKGKVAGDAGAGCGEGKLIGIDFDPANIELARAKLQGVWEVGHAKTKKVSKKSNRSLTVAALTSETSSGVGYELFHNNFAALPTVIAQAGYEKVDAVLADLGVASPQIDDPERGFSYRKNGPLDMRMDMTRGQTAAALINRIPEAELAEALQEYGDETDGPIIAKMIVQRREIKPFSTTQELAAVVCQARDFTMQRAAGAKLHPAARTFQALRIMVNREMANLDRLLTVLPDCLKPGGVAAIISFHSGEDRRVKLAFREGQRAGIYSEISPEVIIADAQEQEENARSRSAKLRWARRA